MNEDEQEQITDGVISDMIEKCEQESSDDENNIEQKIKTKNKDRK